MPAHHARVMQQRWRMSISILLPLGGLLWLVPRLIKPDHPFARAIHMISVRDCYAILAGKHPLIAFQQQRFCIGVSPLSSQTGAQQTFGSKSLPFVRPVLAIKLGGLARQGFGLDEPPLR